MNIDYLVEAKFQALDHGQVIARNTWKYRAHYAHGLVRLKSRDVHMIKVLIIGLQKLHQADQII
jgi:hypothetical protein